MVLIALYLFIDEWGKQSYQNAKIGGFGNERAAINAIARRSKCGYVTDSNNHVLFIVRNGMKIS